MLTALGGCEPQPEVHINAALNVGLTPAEITEALLHPAACRGTPRALNATFAAKWPSPDATSCPLATPA